MRLYAHKGPGACILLWKKNEIEGFKWCIIEHIISARIWSSVMARCTSVHNSDFTVFSSDTLRQNVISLNPLTAKLSNLNFHPLEVVSR